MPESAVGQQRKEVSDGRGGAKVSAMPTKGTIIRCVVLPLTISMFITIYYIKLLIGFVISFFVKSSLPLVVRTPEERFSGLEQLGYTFKSHYADLPIGGGKTLPRVHYIDEGPRDAVETILCLHGEPSWSFLYRHVVPGLVAAGYRVVVPDFIGFGKSDKFTHPEDYSHSMHTMTVRLLLDHLQVKNLTLVCQDWGGLTGLSVVKDCPQLFSRLVIMNTGLPSGEHFSLESLDKITPFLTWRTFTQMMGTSLPIRWIFWLSLKTASSPVLDAYAAPFPDSSYKAGTAMWPLLVPVFRGSVVAGDMRETQDFLKTKWRGRTLIMFCDNDPITGQEVKTFKRLLPKATQMSIRGGGHFLQEMRGEEIATNVVKFIKDSK